MRQLNKIEKKLGEIKTDLFNKALKNVDFINVCNNIMKNIIYYEIDEISKDIFQKIREDNFKNLIGNQIKIENKLYIILDEQISTVPEIHKEYNTFISSLKSNNIIFQTGTDLSILNEKKRNVFKTIVLIIGSSFFYNNGNKLKDLKDNFQFNPLYKIIIYLKNDNEESKISLYQNIYDLNFDFIYNLNDILKVIKNKENNKILYSKFQKFLEDELFYKFIIKQYFNLFKKTIYCERKNINDKIAQIMVKISQDIQFSKSFNFDGNISLHSQTIDYFKSELGNESIHKFIENFLKDTNIMTDINNILLEFEQQFKEKVTIKDEKKVDGLDVYKSNIETGDKNIDNNKQFIDLNVDKKMELNKNNNDNINEDEKGEDSEDLFKTEKN